ncbi:MAG: DASS family sodium-coupled anion symporter [Flavobacteriales bacterium]|nr:DASS family sodium-coupled anion symporter [Flavobacteriales bacterium]
MTRRLLLLFLGPTLFVLFWTINPAVDRTTGESHGVVLWMLTWWITEIVPMAITSLLPIMLFPMLGVLSLEKTCLSYSNRFVFLFLGGFIIALAMEKWQLHRRLALNIVNRTGTSANRIVFGFFLASFLISMWISNTATTLMMLPIAGSVVALLVNEEKRLEHRGTKNFATSLMLSIAYGASIGGIATIVGSPPNASMAGILDKTFHYDVTFMEWMKFGLPFSIVLLVLAYFLMVKVIFPNKLGKFELGHEIIQQELKQLGKWKKPERIVFVVFALTAILWIVQGPIATALKPFGIEFTDTAIAIIMASLLFVIPSGEQKQKTVLEWKDTEKLPWGVLLMFGGGMSLAEAFSNCGLVESITGAMNSLDKSNLFLFVSMLSAIGLVMTALMSNIAMVNIFVPVVGALAVGAGIPPVIFAIPVTIASSCDFMFPMSTPPNAIAYSSGYIHSKDMLKAGIVLNILSLLLLMGLVYFVV